MMLEASEDPCLALQIKIRPGTLSVKGDHSPQQSPSKVCLRCGVDVSPIGAL
jgi:hypothetical protein